MTDAQRIIEEVAKQGYHPKPWACPFTGCDFEGYGHDRVPHLLEAHE